MWNPFKRNKEKEIKKTMINLISLHASVSKLEKAGLIHWQVKGKNLLLEQSFAISMMSRGAEAFKRSLDLLAQLKNADLIGEAYEQQRIDLETAAVRKAQELTKTKLTDIDIQRIRQNAREDMLYIDMESIHDAIHEFDIMIIRSNAISSADATEEGGQLVAVGHFDGKKVEMAMWDEIKNDLKEEK